MKFISLIIIVTANIATLTNVYASENADAMLASALISPQIQQQVNEFNQLVEDVYSVKIESDNDLKTITLFGIVLHGGDIICGTATLEIQKKSQPGFGFNRIIVYHATVSKNLSSVCR